MAEQEKTVAEAVNSDIEQINAEKQPVVEQVQTVVEVEPEDKSITINDDGVSTVDDLAISDAPKVEPVVTLNTVTEIQGKDYRLNNKYGAKTAEGETAMNSDLNYQSLFALGRK